MNDRNKPAVGNALREDFEIFDGRVVLCTADLDRVEAGRWHVQSDDKIGVASGIEVSQHRGRHRAGASRHEREAAGIKHDWSADA